jgi:casein kinase 1
MKGSNPSPSSNNNLEDQNQYNNNANSDPETSQSDDFKLPIISKKFFIIDNKYACFKNFCIGSGSFGKVLYGMSVDRKEEFGIKFEKSNIKNSVIMEELKIYSDLKGGDGIPNIYWKGDYKNYKVFIMDLLGPSLDKFYKINNKLSLQTTIIFGEQMVTRLEYLHTKNYIHRDVKPNNFLLGKYNRKFDDDKVYVIDFGLSKEYIDKRTKKHYEFNDNSKFVGTPRYASINTHMGIRQSRRDDLESVAYILIYFLNGELPWQGIRAKTKSEKKEKIKVSKVNFDVLLQCANKKDIPQELMVFLEYTKSLEFSEKPDYNYIKSLFERIKKNNNPEMFDKNKLMWEWNLEFLSTKKDLEKKNLASYSHYEKIYRKLYEGYPIPEFDEFLENLEKMENSRNFKSDNLIKNTNSKSSFTMNKLKEANSPLKKISIGDKLSSANKSIFSEKANFEINKDNETNSPMKYTMFNDVEGSKFNNKIKNDNDAKEKIKIGGKIPMKIKNEIIMENADDDENNLYNMKNDERKSRKLDK